jgi:hypothetical protein
MQKLARLTLIIVSRLHNFSLALLRSLHLNCSCKLFDWSKLWLVCLNNFFPIHQLGKILNRQGLMPDLKVSLSSFMHHLMQLSFINDH